MMNKSSTRTAVLLLGLFTAVVHLVVLNVFALRDKGSLDPLFTPNGIGYLVLLYAVLRPPSFLAGNSKLVHYVFILFTALTIVAFFIFGGTGLGGRYFDPLGYVTKISELFLIFALWRHMNQVT